MATSNGLNSGHGSRVSLRARAKGTTGDAAEGAPFRKAKHSAVRHASSLLGAASQVMAFAGGFVRGAACLVPGERCPRGWGSARRGRGGRALLCCGPAHPRAPASSETAPPRLEKRRLCSPPLGVCETCHAHPRQTSEATVRSLISLQIRGERNAQPLVDSNMDIKHMRPIFII